MQSKDEYFEKQRELYRRKNEHMDALYDRVDPYTFYREIFPEGSLEHEGEYSEHKGNGIALSVSEERKKHFLLFDEMENLEDMLREEFIFMSPVSYFGRSRHGKNARWLFAIAFDLDGVGYPQLRDVLHQMRKEVSPQATFVVNSGTGLHLYYQLEEPVPMYPQNQRFLKELKFALTYMIWNKYTSTIKEPQVQGGLQGFRLVGSPSKLGRDYPVTAWRTGEKISVEGLLGFLHSDLKDSAAQRVLAALSPGTISLEEAKEKYPEWYDRRIIRGESRNHWTVKRDLYDWWKQKVYENGRVGHRFYCIMCLAIYAVKCGISEEELRKDAYELMEHLDLLTETEDNHFTAEDVEKALEMYNESFVTFPRDDIARLSGIVILKNKRNGRNQEAHLNIARGKKEVLKRYGELEKDGRPSKEGIIREYMIAHEDITSKTEIANALGIHRNTVARYYNEIREEMERQKNGMDAALVDRKAEEVQQRLNDLKKLLRMK